MNLAKFFILSQFYFFFLTQKLAPPPVGTDQLSSVSARSVGRKGRLIDVSYVCVCVWVPPGEAQWSGPESVHEDAEWQRSSTEQEGANGKAQVEHFLLLYAADQILMIIRANISYLCVIFYPWDRESGETKENWSEYGLFMVSLSSGFCVMAEWPRMAVSECFSILSRAAYLCKGASKSPRVSAWWAEIPNQAAQQKIPDFPPLPCRPSTIASGTLETVREPAICPKTEKTESEIHSFGYKVMLKL